MANISITIEYNEVPVPNAALTLGEYKLKKITTDENGYVSTTVPDDFSIVALLVVEGAPCGKRISGPLHLVAGGDYTIDLYAET